MAEVLSDTCGNCGAQLESGARKCPSCRAVRITKMVRPGSVLFGSILLFWLGTLLLLVGHLPKSSWQFHLNDVPLITFIILCTVLLVIVRMKARRVVIWRRPPILYKNGTTLSNSALAAFLVADILGYFHLENTVLLVMLGILFVLLFVPPALRIWGNLPGRIQFWLIIISAILIGGILWHMRANYMREQYGG